MIGFDSQSGFLLILLAGFAGSFHCVGMCGGFACGLGRDPGGSRIRTIVRHLLYNSGRLVTYMFIGALAGQLGALVAGMDATSAMTNHSMSSHDMPGHNMTGHDMVEPMAHSGSFQLAGNFGILQRVLSVIAGALMLIMALRLLGLLPSSRRSWFGSSSEFFSSALQSIMKSRSAAAPLSLGVINGFLPCPLVYAFAAMAAASGSVVTGIFTMAALGFGTFPAMLFMGAVGGLIGISGRRTGVYIAGSFVLFIAAITLTRGIAPELLHFASHST